MGGPLDIVAMLLWIFTAAAGVYLLAARRPARGAEDSPGASTGASVPAAAPAPAGTSAARTASAPATAAAPAGTPAPAAAPARATAGVPPAAAAAYAAGAKVPPVTHTRITTRPGEHPLLEFMHPALGLVGLGCWMAFVFTRFSAFAWVALGVITVTIAAGVSWYTVNTRAGRAGRAAGPGSSTGTGSGTGTATATGTGTGTPAGPYPAQRARRLLVHGSGAAVTLVLALVTALIAHHT